MTITIPPAALEAGKRCICLNGCGPDVRCDYCFKTARAAFLAMIEAWSGRAINRGYEVTEVCGDHLILPLPTEASDGK